MPRLDTQYWKERAEAAEAKTIETLENILLALGVDPNGIDEIYMEQTAKGVINAILERIADLEAQLAANAGEWRPVTEKPDADMDVEMIVIGMYKSDDNVFWDEYFGAMVEPTHWRPAPPQE